MNVKKLVIFCFFVFLSCSMIAAQVNGEAYNLEDTFPDPSPSLEAQIHQREVEHLIKKAILSLSEDQRVVVIMRQYQELPFAEIASILNCPTSTVKSRMRYALNHLRIILQSYGIDKDDNYYIEQ